MLHTTLYTTCLLRVEIVKLQNEIAFYAVLWSHLNALFANCQGSGEWILLALISCKVYGKRRTKYLVIGKGCGLETERQLTAASSDFVAYLSASPTVHVKQIFIAVFYLHFLLSDHDIFFSCFFNKCIFFIYFFLFAWNLLCRSFWCCRLAWSIFYYLAFHFVAVGNEIFLHIKNILTSCCDNVFALFMWQIHLLPVRPVLSRFYITYFISLYSFPARCNITR